MDERDLTILHNAMKGNLAAEHLIRDLWFVLSVWDDLVDKDKPRTDDDINSAFWRIFATVPANPFYQANFSELFPLVKAAVVSWQASNGLEQDQPVMAKAMSLEFISFVSACARICGGYEHSLEVTRAHWLTSFLRED